MCYWRSVKPLVFAVAGLLSGVGGIAAAAESPVDVSNKSQLFVDRVLVRLADGVWFTQHEGEKHPLNPLLKADQPWEGWRVCLYGSALYDGEEKLFKMWYYAEGDASYFGGKVVLCYATSSDGIHWRKPPVGTLRTANGRPTNAVAHVNPASVIKDVDDADPTRRYKCIGWDSRPEGPNAYGTFVSPDGLDWKAYSTSPIAPDRDMISGFWDPARRLYVAFTKKHTPWRGQTRRLFRTSTSEDFLHWGDPVLSWTTDLRDDAGSLARIEQVRPILDRPDDPDLLRTEFYGIGVYPADSCTIGFPWILTVNNDARWGNHEGPTEVQLAVSRDLVHWQRPFRTPVIGFDGVGAWDAGTAATAASAFRVGDTIYLYYGGANYTHGTPVLYREQFEDGRPTGRKTKYNGSVGLVTWKLDRFVSVDGPAAGGTLSTVPIRFAGKRLEINAATRPGGSIVVELLDAGGRPIEGFGPSVPFSGDELRHRVVFGDAEDVSSLAGRPVTLRFRITDASLYSFAFRD